MLKLKKNSLLKTSTFGIAVTFFVLTAACSHQAIRPANNDAANETEISAVPDPLDSPSSGSGMESLDKESTASEALPEMPTESLAPATDPGFGKGSAFGSVGSSGSVKKSAQKGKGKNKGYKTAARKKSGRRSSTKKVARSKSLKLSPANSAKPAIEDSQLQQAASASAGTVSGLPSGDSQLPMPSQDMQAQTPEIPVPPPAVDGALASSEEGGGRWTIVLMSIGVIALLAVAVPKLRRRKLGRGGRLILNS